MIRTAKQAGIGRLFHYQKFRAEYVADALLRDRVKFSDPRTFNDPWDCRPRFSKSLLDDPKVYERHIEYVSDLQRIVLKVPEPELTRRSARLRTDRAFMEERIDECTKGICDAITQKYRVYCLSSVPDSFLMWAHYTNSHRGVCLGFETASEAFCGALKVTYSEMYPAIDLTTEDEWAFLRDTLLTKADAWRYEHEFRLVAKECASESFITVRDGFASFAPQDLRMMIVGCSITDDDLRTLREIIAARKSPITLYRARPAADRYALTIEEFQ